MTLKSLTIIALVAAGFTAIPDSGRAQGRIQEIPANFPPPSYTGRQFVDNNGCVYVRAGFDGAVTWVPRVSRQRRQICGQTPTFGSTTAAAPAPAAAAAPIKITLEAPKPPVTEAPAAPAPVAAASAAPSPAPAPTIVSKPKPRVTTTTTAPAVRTVAAAPRVIKAPASKPVAAEPPRVLRPVPVAEPAPMPANARIVRATSAWAAACQGQTGRVTRVVNGKTLTVRCGPQETAHVFVVRRGEQPSADKNVYNNPGWQNPSSPSGQMRIVPRHVYEQRDDQVVKVPKGYRPAWDDDRLNRYRAVQTVEGHLATQEVWTNTVPRKLVAQTGKPAKIKQPVIAYRATSRLAPVVSTQDGAAVQKAPIVSTKSAPRKPAGAARWVEVGVFTTEAKAQAAARRLQAAGLPVKFGVFRKGGQEMRRVLVGPFASEDAISGAISAVHRVGYTSAYLR